MVTCPTILEAECKFCFKRGHWANEKFCPALREKNRISVREKNGTLQRKTAVSLAKNYGNLATCKFGGFAVFNEPDMEEPIARKPTPCKPAELAPTVREMSFASVLSKTCTSNPPIINTVNNGFTTLASSRNSMVPLPSIRSLPATSNNISRTRWADLESDDEEEEEEESFDYHSDNEFY